MKATLKALLTLATLFQAASAYSTPAWMVEPEAAQDKSIYGADNRIELYNASPETFRLADSVVSLWSSGDVRPDAASGTFSLNTIKFADAMNLCPGEAFREQPIGAFCSGSLVGEDLVMTAGHCITDEAQCLDTKIVFGFGIRNIGGAPPARIAQSEVYGCKKIITRFLGGEEGYENPAGQRLGPDYALIQLDRQVTRHKPLPINRGRNLKQGDRLMVIGHPVGLPLKIAAGASVRDASVQGYFVANLDTFGGNSGSPVFNTATRLIEGILVRGDEDFVRAPEGCTTMATYPRSGGRGEDVTKVSVLESFIPRAGLKSEPPVFRDMNFSETPPPQDGIEHLFDVAFE